MLKTTCKHCIQECLAALSFMNSGCSKSFMKCTRPSSNSINLMLKFDISDVLGLLMA